MIFNKLYLFLLITNVILVIIISIISHSSFIDGYIGCFQEKGVKRHPVCGLVKAANGHNKLRYKFDWS